MAKIYEQLPVVNQTTAVKNFFESTVEQLFAEANSEIITGFIGKKTSNDHNVDISYHSYAAYSFDLVKMGTNR